MMIELAYISYIIFIHIVFGLLEAFFYKNYGKFNRKQWIIDSLMFSKYHLIAWLMFVTPIVLFPSIFYFIITSNLHNFIRLLSIGGGVYFIALIIEDHLFFIFAKHKFGPKNAPWHKGWLGIGKLKIPISYIIAMTFAFILFYLASFVG